MPLLPRPPYPSAPSLPHNLTCYASPHLEATSWVRSSLLLKPHLALQHHIRPAFVAALSRPTGIHLLYLYSFRPRTVFSSFVPSACNTGPHASHAEFNLKSTDDCADLLQPWPLTSTFPSNAKQRQVHRFTMGLQTSRPCPVLSH